MLKVMRDSFHQLKWILIAVVAAFVFGFVFIDMGLGGGQIGGDDSQNFAARVNGETITLLEYERSLNNLQQMYQQAYGQQFTPEMAANMGLETQVLNSLIDQRLLIQEASRLHLAASPVEIRKKLLEIPTFSPEGKFVGLELYTRYVTSRGYTSASDFEQELGRQISLEKIDSALMSSLVVSPKAAEAEYKRNNENAKIRYVLVPAAQFAAAASVTPAEVETYFKNNQAKYAHGEQRTIRYLLADYEKIRQQVTPTEAELRRRYESTKDSYKQPAGAHTLHILVKVDPKTATPEIDAAAKAKAESLVKQLRAGADFAALARANSDDPSSSGQGGDMGWVEKGQTVEPFDRAIFSIPFNQISDPIRSEDFGYHIVKVLARREAGTRPFEVVRPQIAMQVQSEMARDIARSEINRIHAMIKQNKPATPQAFIALANDKVTSSDSGWFGRNDTIGALGNHQPLAEWVFGAKKGDISDPLGTNRGITIAYVESTRPAGTSSLAEVRPKVEQEARQAKARELARAALSQMMLGAANIDAVAQKAGKPATEAVVNRQGGVPGFTGDITPLVDGAIAANLGEIKGPVTVADGAVAFQVLEQKKVTAEELAKNRASLIDQLRNQQARSLRQSLVQKLRKAADIEINDSIARPTTSPAGV